MQIPVSKYHGCGNDFIMLPYTEVQDWPQKKLEDFIVRVCDRHTGIGADGAIFVKENPLEMVYYNQNGSRADMCGNGIRCFAKFCYDNHLENSGMYTVETLAGPHTIAELSKDPFMVQVCMGKPIFDNGKIAVSLDTPIWNYPLDINGTIWNVYSFYMGTIHTVVFVSDAFDPALEEVGKAICHHPLFEKQTNVNFVEVLDENNLKAATYERGCGMTLACGTGMCASAVTAFKEGKTSPHVGVQMKKGTLHIDLDKDGTVFLTGPAERIMKGTYDYVENQPENAA